MKRSLVLKATTVVILGMIYLSSPSQASASASSFCGGQCRSDCPSPFDWDAVCHALCGHTAMGWCPSNQAEYYCAPWDVMLACGIGSVE